MLLLDFIRWLSIVIFILTLYVIGYIVGYAIGIRYKYQKAKGRNYEINQINNDLPDDDDEDI